MPLQSKRTSFMNPRPKREAAPPRERIELHNRIGDLLNMPVEEVCFCIILLGLATDYLLCRSMKAWTQCNGKKILQLLQKSNYAPFTLIF